MFGISAVGSISRFDLGAIAEQYGTEVFFETGTHRGHGVQHALNCGIKTIHSVEINPYHYLRAKYAFSSYSNVYIHLGSSHEILSPLLESLADTKSIFFWLDAHFSYDQASNCDSFSSHSDKANMPIIEELKSIFSARPHFNDVILMDDLSCFTYDENIPDRSFDDSVKRYIDQNPSLEGKSKKDLVGTDLDEILECVPYQYKPQKIYQDAGFLLINRR